MVDRGRHVNTRLQPIEKVCSASETHAPDGWRGRERVPTTRHARPVWSGNTERHRLSRTGNRQLNVALHRIAITQLRLGGLGAA